LNKVFSESCGDDVLYVAQVTLENLEEARAARRRISDESWHLYTNGDPRFDKLEEIARVQPRPGHRGYVFYVMTLDGEIVGLSNHYYYESAFENYVVHGGLVVLDEYQRRGIATAYSHISVRIAKSMGAICFYGQTRVGSPMYKLRMRQGWQQTGVHNTRDGESFANIRLML